MGKRLRESEDKVHRRSLGVHLTSSNIFLEYILPTILDELWAYIWIDLYAGEGNLILPILDSIAPNKKIDFFKKHVYLYDIQEEMVQKCIKNAESYGIPSEIAVTNINLRDNLESFPSFLKKCQFPLYHITNPPYLYLGYIRKHIETQKYLKFFNGKNLGFQDLYQIAMMNDLRNKIEKIIYLIPTNFLFGASVSNKFRKNFLEYYNIKKMIIFETKIFEFTGTNICIGFFKRKKVAKSESIKFPGIKFKKQNKIIKKEYILKPEFKYRAGSEFNEFCGEFIANNPLNVKYYLLKEEVINNKGDNEIKAIDANEYNNNEYDRVTLHVNNNFKDKIESNILYIRTVDTGSQDGRVGLGIISEDFNVKGIYVSGNTYRTHPIQIFFIPKISQKDQTLLKNYFNFVLETFREKLDSEFLTTYKYSTAVYTRKYLGLTQTRDLIKTLPLIRINSKIKIELNRLINSREFGKSLKFLKEIKKRKMDINN